VLPTATATELAAAYRDGTADPVEVIRALIDRIAGLDGQVNAVLIVSPTALADAADSASRIRDRRPRSALEGVPVLLKDNIDTVDLPTTAGSRLLLDSRPVRDAPLVERLRDAGAVVLGKTNLSEWSNFRSTGSISGWSGVGGQTHNPHVLDRNTSGSSAGSAAAVAAAYAPLAIGTETDGSILSPGAHCGVVGFKPTVGLVPGAGIVPISSAQDTAGPMARSVADAALLLAVLAGRPVEPVAATAHPVLAWWRPTPIASAEPAAGGALALDHFDRCLALLADAGFDLVEVGPPPDEEINDVEFPAMLSEMARDLTAYLAGRPGAPADIAALIAGNEADPIELSLFGQERFTQALAADPAGSPAALDARQRASSLASDWLDEALAGGRAAVLSPTCGPARPIGHGNELGAFSTYSAAAVAGTPSVTVPVGTVGASGVLPVGLALSGARGADAELLGLAARLEAMVGRLVTPRLLATLDGD
jgi:amidase